MGKRNQNALYFLKNLFSVTNNTPPPKKCSVRDVSEARRGSNTLSAGDSWCTQ